MDIHADDLGAIASFLRLLNDACKQSKVDIDLANAPELWFQGDTIGFLGNDGGIYTFRPTKDD